MIVGENSEISAAKSVISETNRSTSSRPKPSIASTTSSSQTNSNTATGGKNLFQMKRFRRNIDRTFISSSSSNYYFSSTTETPLHDLISINSQSSTIDDDFNYLSSSTNNGVTNSEFEQLTTEESFDDLIQNDEPSLVDIDFNDVESLDIDNEKLKTLYNKEEINENIIFHPLIEKKEKIDKTKWKNEENEIGKYGLTENSPIYKVHDANNNLTAKHVFNNKISTQRILVNISIATDGGSGTTNHAVYVLNVAVPADSNLSPTLYDPNDNNDDNSNESSEQSFVPPPEPPPAPPCPCKCNSNILENLENSENLENEVEETTLDEGSGDDFMPTTSSTNDDEIISTTIVDDSIVNETFSCPDFLTTPILILEGERVFKKQSPQSSINQAIFLN